MSDTPRSDEAVKKPRYVCAVHGDIGTHVINSTIVGHQMMLCQICFLERLKDIGVQEVEEQP